LKFKLESYFISSEDNAFETKTSSAGKTNLLFTAHLSSSLNATRPFRVILYDVVDVNENNVYNKITGCFRAEAYGVYLFFVTVSTTSNIYQIEETVCLIHNFQPLDNRHETIRMEEKGICRTKTFCTTLTMDKGDELWVMRLGRLGTDADWNHKAVYYSTFSGAFINHE